VFRVNLRAGVRNGKLSARWQRSIGQRVDRLVNLPDHICRQRARLVGNAFGKLGTVLDPQHHRIDRER